jgi:hypothetical protein
MLLGFGGACETPGVHTPPQPIEIETDSAEIPPEALGALAEIERAYDELFGVHPTGLVIELVTEVRRRPVYDHFDTERNAVRMGWRSEDPAGSKWTLAHELAHAWQFHLDPEAYAREPSWIHEGLAEYAVWAWLDVAYPERAARLLERTASARLNSAVSFAALYDDIYAFDWQVAYPTCHLAVQVLARRSGARAVLDYFVEHGTGAPLSAFRRAFGCDPRDLDLSIEALAGGLTPATR